MKVKEHFTSRFKNGVIIQADLSQVEVCVAAQLSNDGQLIKLLNEGRDVHKFMVSNIYGDPESSISKDDPRRKAVKPGTFGILYGNGASRLSENTGMDVDWCKNFIDTFYKLFPRIKLWHQWLQERVEKEGQITLPTGSILKFKKFPAKFDWQIRKGVIESYNPPDIKNWPVQHFAQIIMATWVGQFLREKGMAQRDKYLIINEIHDSLMLDSKEEFKEQACNDIQEVCNKLPEYFVTYWGIELKIPINCEIKVGKSWAEV